MINFVNTAREKVQYCAQSWMVLHSSGCGKIPTRCSCDVAQHFLERLVDIILPIQKACKNNDGLRGTNRKFLSAVSTDRCPNSLTHIFADSELDGCVIQMIWPNNLFEVSRDIRWIIVPRQAPSSTFFFR